MALQLPTHIQPYAADFHWDNTKLWMLDIPTVGMPIDELLWHLDIPWLHTEGERFNLTPHEIMSSPEKYKEQHDRTMRSDLDYPIDIIYNNGRWLILDGLHRLMKSVALGKSSVEVRKISRDLIPQIEIKE